MKRLVSLRELVSDLFSSVFNMESRLWKTLFQLPVPGKLTESYFLGRRAQLLTPFRIFFIVAVAHFAILAVRINDSVHTELERFATKQRHAAFEKQYFSRLDSLINDTKADFPRSSAALDSLGARTKSEPTLQVDDSIAFLIYKDRQFSTTETKIALEDILTLPGDVLREKYAVTNPFSRIQLQIIQRMLQNPESFMQFLLSKLIWLAILLVPALALVMQLLYIRRKRYFVEHLVFSLHYHTLAFALMGLFFQFFHRQPQLVGWFLLLIFVYGFLAMRRFYGQGWGKTFLKFNILLFFYLLLVSISQVAVFLLSAIIYGNS